jgi:alpha-amylase/alpha-mannosidase (GH57 family)
MSPSSSMKQLCVNVRYSARNVFCETYQKMRTAQKKLRAATYGGVVVVIVLEHLLDGFSYLGLVVL